MKKKTEGECMESKAYWLARGAKAIAKGNMDEAVKCTELFINPPY